MMYNNNNISIKLVSTMEEVCTALAREIKQSITVCLLCHCTCLPIDTRTFHANKHKEDATELLKDIIPTDKTMLIKQWNNNNNYDAKSKDQIKALAQ